MVTYTPELNQNVTCPGDANGSFVIIATPALNGPYTLFIENFSGIDDKSMQFLIRSLDNELIVVALKGADDSLSEKFFSSMSQRAAANIKDEMEALGPMRLTDVQEAQKQVIAVARQLADEGSIVLSGRGGDEYL